MSPIHVLVADDYADWRRQIRWLIQGRPELQIICEVADGLEAVRKADEWKPLLILLDIGLPKLNGIDAAYRIRQISPCSRILFVSMDSSPDTIQAGLNTGALGFVYKSQAARDLLPAIDAVLRGEQFVSSGARR